MKTSELTGAALDWAVDKCLGKENEPYRPSYSTDWAQAGPIIEREKIQISPIGENDTFGTRWSAQWLDSWPNVDKFSQTHGPTPLIAAMRCYVASELGNEVEIPEELI